MIANDLDLLRAFVREHSQDAFAALVQRHVNLVHSAALRQVGTPHLAEDVAQCVFTDLARNAHRLKSDTILTAWLYQVTRRTAIDVVRREAGRQSRERIAMEMLDMNANAADWTHIAPLLDEAMHMLDETDRAAVLLRYFENKSLREVGETLGTSVDTAQKRVSRAVERLREFFAKRGVTVGASGLVVVISANAVQVAPAGLAAMLSGVAFAGVVTGSRTLTLLKLMTMTKLKAGIIGAIIIAGVTTTLVIQHYSSAGKLGKNSLVHAPWSDVGMATPEAALQTFLSALTNGDTNRLAAVFFWNSLGPITPQLQNMMRTQEQTNLARWAASIESFQIVSTEPMGPDGLLLTLVEKTRDGSEIKSRATLYQMANEWHVSAHITAPDRTLVNSRERPFVTVDIPLAPQSYQYEVDRQEWKWFE